jgi:ketosteroid isomerase-like protein
MLRWFTGVMALTPFVLVFLQEGVPPSLSAMADTERAFAQTAKAKGIRDAFLEFFAEDSIAFSPAPVSARERLLKRPSQPFSVAELTWEPRLGDVARAGDLGWLTGPSTFIAHAGPDQTPHYGNYLSVWRKQSSGQWRVYIDIGAAAPSQVAFAPGFQRVAFANRYQGQDSKEAGSASLKAADEALDSEISKGAAAAYRSRLTPVSRLHRTGMLPLTGPPAIAEWLAAHAAGMTASAGRAEAASSADLGYSYGTYEIPGSTPESGAYVRIWNRDGQGRWWVMIDITEPTSRPR